MSNLENLAAKILKESQQPDSQELKILLLQLAEVANTPGDITSLIGPVVKLLPSHNSSVKFTIYGILPRICKAQPDAAVLVVNTVLNDCRDPNPEVKRIAVSTLCSLPPLLQEYAGPVVDAALKDRHPKVRNAAVLGCGKIFKEMPSLLQDIGMIDRLYETIRDEDPVVSTNCLLVLDTVLASEGGVVVSRSMARYLLHRLPMLPHPQLATVLQFLAKHKPSTEDELFFILSEVDPFLGVMTSPPVVVSCARLFLHLTESSQPQLEPQLVERVAPTLRSYLQSTDTSQEGLHCLLDFLLSLKDRPAWMSFLGNMPELLYPVAREDHAISVKKLELLACIINKDTSSDTAAKVAAVLREQCAAGGPVAMAAARCLCACAARSSLSTFLTVSASLLVRDSVHYNVTAAVLDGLQDVSLDNFPQEDISDLLCKVIDVSDATKDSPPPILPVLLGAYGELLGDRAVHVLESLVDRFNYYNDEGICHLLLSAALRLFIKMPARVQHILGELLEACIIDRDEFSELRWRALKFYNMLKADPQLVRTVLGLDKKEVTS